MPIRRATVGTKQSCLKLVASLLLLLALPAALQGAPAWHDAVDYTKLKTRLGAATPTGAGVPISLVEAPVVTVTGPPALTSYLADPSNPEFSAGSDPLGVAATITDGSMVTHTGFSGHATGTVGSYFFGNTLSIAPGANSVVNYEASHWLASILRVSGSANPEPQPYRVQNFSWVSQYPGTGTQELSALRRLDYLVESSEMTAVVGANNYNVGNSTTWTHPTLFAHSYNAIVAGRSDGYHSRGQTSAFYGSGRYRPDLVAPANTTSNATAQISSAATLLHQSVTGTEGANSEVIKATLMAGATKNEFLAWTDPTTGLANPWNRTHTRPLDDVMGAGELNIYNSYLIQLGGQQAASVSAPTTAVGSYGWDYQNRKNDSAVGDLFYNFEIAAGSTAPELSIMLAWNAKITDTNPSEANFSPLQSLQNLDLQLYDSTAGFMGTMLDQSISAVDNVEHIYRTNLGPGTYTLKVSGAANWDYGLAWRMTTAFDQPTADFDGDGAISGGDFLVWQRNFGKLLGATNSEGDGDGDGDVDAEDLALWKAGAISPLTPPMLASIAAVPEPATAGMLALTATALLGARQFRSRRR